VTYRSYCEGEHERSNRWCLTTAVVGFALAVLVLVVTTGLPTPDSTCLFGSTLTPLHAGEVPTL
jgi:hypothetical protein